MPLDVTVLSDTSHSKKQVLTSIVIYVKKQNMLMELLKHLIDVILKILIVPCIFKYLKKLNKGKKLCEKDKKCQKKRQEDRSKKEQ